MTHVHSCWQDELARQIDRCDFGLLCIRPSFLASTCVTSIELPALLAGGPVIPVMLEAVPIERAELHGLQQLQIVRYRRPQTDDQRAFRDCGTGNHERFCDALARQVADRMLAPNLR